MALSFILRPGFMLVFKCFTGAHSTGCFSEAPWKKFPASGMAPATQIKKADLERPGPLEAVPQSHYSVHRQNDRESTEYP